MQKRIRVHQVLSLSERLKIFSDQLKARASRLDGEERKSLLMRAKIAETAKDIEDWSRSPQSK